MKIGIIGLGKIAQTKYLPVLSKMRQVKMVALCDKSISLTDSVIKNNKLEETIACYSIDELIERKPEMVFVLTHEHYYISKKLIENKISVCVEKPLCWSSCQAKELAEYARNHGVKIFAAYMKQYDNTFKCLQNEISKRGTPLAVNITCYAGNNKKWCDSLFSIDKESLEEKKNTKQELKNAWDSFYANDLMGKTEGRTESQLLLQLGIHQLNLIKKLFGNVEVKSVLSSHNGNTCTINTLFHADPGISISYSLVPMFSGPWLWEEKYEIIFQDSLLIYHPGCPFLPISDAYLEIIDGKESLKKSTISMGMIDPFRIMIERIIDKCSGSEKDDSVLEAIEDIELVEKILISGKIE